MVHESAAAGYQAESETYVSARPGYHPVILDALVDQIDPTSVIDLGAGTGIATAALIERGVTVIAVEPVQAMRAQLGRAIPQASVLEGTAESIPADDASVAAVLAAQAFHWFNHGPTLDEIARVLRPGGHLATLWNVRDETVPWMAAYTAIVDQEQGDTPRYRTMRWRRAIEADPRFDLTHEQRQPNPQRSNVELTVGRFLSTSFIATLDRVRRDELVLQVRELVAGMGESYDFPYISEVQIWRYSGAA